MSEVPLYRHFVRGTQPHHCHFICGIQPHYRRFVCGRERELFIDNFLIRIRCIIEMRWWTSLAPWEFEFLSPSYTLNASPLPGDSAHASDADLLLRGLRSSVPPLRLPPHDLLHAVPSPTPKSCRGVYTGGMRMSIFKDFQETRAHYSPKLINTT